MRWRVFVAVFKTRTLLVYHVYFGNVMFEARLANWCMLKHTLMKGLHNIYVYTSKENQKCIANASYTYEYMITVWYG